MLDPFTHSSLPLLKSLSEQGVPFTAYENESLWALKSGIGNPYFNFLLIKENSSSSIEEALNFFDPLPFECTFASNDKNRLDQCEKLGLILGEKTVGMRLCLENFENTLNQNKIISVHQVNNESDLRQWINITSLGFKLSRNYIKAFAYPILSTGNKKFHFALGFVNGLPAATSLVFLDPPYASVFSLVTLPRYRKMELAPYLLQESLSLAKEMNITSCTVESYTFTKKEYEKMGFQETQELLTYISVPKKNEK